MHRDLDARRPMIQNQLVLTYDFLILMICVLSAYIMWERMHCLAYVGHVKVVYELHEPLIPGAIPLC